MARVNGRNFFGAKGLAPTKGSVIPQQYALTDILMYITSLKPPSVRQELKDGSIALKGNEFKTWTSPRIYLWLRDGELLYVGVSEASFAGFKRKDEVLDTDEIAVFFIDSKDELGNIRRRLIDAYKPFYNRAMEDEREPLPTGHEDALDSMMERLKK